MPTTSSIAAPAAASRLLKKRSWLFLGAAFAIMSSLFRTEIQAQLYWNTNGASASWMTANWDTTPSGTFTTAWTANSNVQFTADSSVTFATTSIGNVTVADGKTVTITSAGTLSTNGLVRTFDIGTGSTLTWTSQNVSSNSTSGFIKNGAGTWNVGAQGNLYNGGFTINAGLVIVSGDKSFGGAGCLLTINGGTIQSSGTRAFANNIVLGGNFTNSGTGNATFSGTVDLGGSTRTITNSLSSGSRIYSGIISGSSGAGLTFDGTSAVQTYISNAANTFRGTITVNASEVGFANNGAFGNANNTIVIDGGRLTGALTDGTATSYTLASTHNLQLGSTAGTSISVPSGGVMRIDGIISDKLSATGAFTKQGAGTLVLGGINTYTGTTLISVGTLQVGAASTGTTGTGNLTVNGASTVLAGTGSVEASSTVVTLGTIKPGDTGGSDVGTLNTKSLQFSPISSTTVAELQIATSSSSDLINITGDLSLNSLSKIFVNGSGYTAAIGHSFTLIDWTGLLMINGFSTGANLRTGNNAAGNEGNLDLPDISAIGVWDISNFSGNGSLTISVVAVPEPSRVLLLALGSCLLIARRKR